MKQPLYKSLNGKILSEMDFYTLLTDIEAALNSWPLAGISEDADDGNILPITPSHLIIGRSLKPLPTEIYKGIEEPKKNVYLKERWKLRHQIMEKFWNSWKKEYLTELRKYHNKTQLQDNLKPGDYVLILTEKTTKMSWPVGVIADTFKGRDGLVRTVEIRLPLDACDIDSTGKPKKQYKSIRRGIESIILLEASKQ